MSLVWRSVGNPGEPYPDWLRALVASSGVYAIREVGILGSKVVYVGESHAGRLKKTIVRHLQNWTRSKDFWRSLFGDSAGTDPGRTYSRSGVEVAFLVSKPSQATKLQEQWIRRLKPRDNLNNVPF